VYNWSYTQSIIYIWNSVIITILLFNFTYPQDVFAYLVRCLCVPLGVCVPQVEDHWFISHFSGKALCPIGFNLLKASYSHILIQTSGYLWGSLMTIIQHAKTVNISTSCLGGLSLQIDNTEVYLCFYSITAASWRHLISGHDWFILQPSQSTIQSCQHYIRNEADQVTLTNSRN
jgi:hypothetical protein